MKKRWQLCQAKGQSLVEMALTLPILILMFVGLIEVGYTLRNYLIVVNANREGVRFAARGRWIDEIDFDANPISIQADYRSVFGRVIAAAGTEQYDGRPVPVLRTQSVDDLPANTGIAVHYFGIPPQVEATGGGCQEIDGNVAYTSWFTGTVNLDDTRIDSDEVIGQAKAENLSFNQAYFCDQALDDDARLDAPSQLNLVIVEIWYNHEWLLGIPFYTEILPDNITLYSQSRMRVTLDRLGQ